ncbi:hypothetical protein H632_c2449p0 [Helicosporidium sp. ATCC 50920]|nr:hypothetical protein H632_c2449p0 [Helicosporidium sp. ATCC 50920]|eukprot:KDD73184.1 hypothetical protein H632_c2449p0 [Helicosporidium sp. ATCC 50920]
MWGWGANRDGQLGLGSLGTVEDGPVAAAPGMVWVAAGAYFACGYDESAALYCWGENDKGQCGVGEAGAALPSPQKIGESVGGVTAGRWHACYFDEPAARGFCWGDNEDGQLGTGSTVAALVPTAIAGERSWEQLSAGYSHTCGIDGAGTALLCWGDGAFGALGLGSEESFSSPQVVSENVPWGAVAAGLWSTCALNQAGVVCFGSNEFGLLGNGSDARYSDVPVLVSGSSGATGVDTWEGTACMLGAAADVKCWGRGDSGQMGDGFTRAVNLLPVGVVGGIHAWSSVSVGGPHVCGAAQSDGQVYCWGSNADGQLGIGTPDPEQSWVPVGVQVQVQTAVAARQENTFAYGVFTDEQS